MRKRPSYGAIVIAVCGLVPLAGCVPQETPRLYWHIPRFNERIRADFEPMTPEDRATDLKYGFFRDGTVDGTVSGLTSELVPAASSAPVGSGSLVQTPCLFVGAERNGAGGLVAQDEVRLTWELIANLGVDTFDQDINELFESSDMGLGLCTMSTVTNRLLFDNPSFPPNPAGSPEICGSVGDDSGLDAALTVSRNAALDYNIPSTCVVGHPFHEVVLEAVARAGPDTDGVCPAGHFDGARRQLGPEGASGWFDEYWSVCGYSPNHVIPTADTSYRLSLKEGTGFLVGLLSERWMSPSVLHVDGSRKIVRPMVPPTIGSDWSWRTVVDPPNGEGAIRWMENFTPSVQVRGVSFVSRGPAGEKGLVPKERTLRIAVPRPSLPTVSARCTLPANAPSFRIPQDCVLESDGSMADVVGALTPTYAPQFLGVTPALTTPVAWSAAFEPLASGTSPFIRFELVARARPAMLRVSSLVDFGRTQKGTSGGGTALIENIGGQPLRVRTIAFGAGSANPGDFSFVAVGSPVEVPLPIEAKREPDGSTVLRMADDAAAAPLLVFDEQPDHVTASLGDPARGAGTEPVTLYGKSARLVGGLLIRDDPAATFMSVHSPDERPFTATAYAERKPPFVVAPGETVKVGVIAQPHGTGTRSAFLRVDAEPLSPGPALWAQSVLRVEGVQGPQTHVAPERLWFNRTGGPPGHGALHDVMVDNVGSLPMSVTQLRLQGPDAARFGVALQSGTLPLSLASQGYVDVHVTYTPQCDGTYGTPTSLAEHQATLVVRSTGGDATIPLSGSSYGFCELP